MRGWVLACAIDALVGCTCAAHLSELLGDGLPGTVEANVGIVAGSVLRGGERIDGCAGEVDLLDGVAVFRLQVADDLLDAGTDLGLQFGLVFFLPFGQGIIHRFGASGGLAVVVDDGVTQNAIEPSDGTLGFAQFRSVLNRLEIGRLEDVFGCR